MAKTKINDLIWGDWKKGAWKEKGKAFVATTGGDSLVLDSYGIAVDFELSEGDFYALVSDFEPGFWVLEDIEAWDDCFWTDYGYEYDSGLDFKKRPATPEELKTYHGSGRLFPDSPYQPGGKDSEQENS